MTMTPPTLPRWRADIPPCHECGTEMTTALPADNGLCMYCRQRSEPVQRLLASLNHSARK